MPNKKKNGTPSEAGAVSSASLEDVRKRISDVSDKLSTQTRTLGLGILAFSWGTLVGDSSVAKSLVSNFKWEFLAIGGLAILALFLDFFQYAAGYFNAKKLFSEMESRDEETGQYDYESFTYLLQNICFYMKQAVLVVAAVWLLVCICTQSYSLK